MLIEILRLQCHLCPVTMAVELTAFMPLGQIAELVCSLPFEQFGYTKHNPPDGAGNEPAHSFTGYPNAFRTMGYTRSECRQSPVPSALSAPWSRTSRIPKYPFT